MIPLERLLIETDSPFLAPTPLRGKRNEPANVVRVAEVVAELRGMAAEEVGSAALANFRRLFAA
jgi:TatD DNase family protein